MAVVKPFSGWHYNKEKFENLNDVVVPPYDVISTADLTKLKEKNKYNYTHVILNDGEEKHKRAAALFHLWQKENIFIQDKKPTLYFYRQKFRVTKLEGFCQNVSGTLTRDSFLARVGLEDYSAKVILPHEKTFSGPKADRYNLMEATQGNMEPVFLGYDSPRFSGDEFQKIVLARKPDFLFNDDSDIEHQLWIVTDENVHKEVEKTLASQKFYILDGHHRYETALKFYKDHQSKDARLDHRYVLAAVCSFRQPGTVILPTHRALKSADFEKGRRVLEPKGWTFTSAESLDDLERLLIKSEGPAFGLRLPQKCYVALISQRKSQKLDLDILHDEIIPEFSVQPEIGYIKDISELEGGVDQREFGLGILVKPSTADEVMEVANAGRVMPHKSTFFYPKIPSGLVVNTFL